MDRPIVIQEVFNLNNVSGGLHAETLSFKNIDMQGDRTVTLRDNVNGGGSLVIFDTNTLTDMRLPMKEVDSATMNPKSRILALRSNLQIQIYNLDMKIRIKTANVSESVAYWRWVDNKTLAIISSSAVYHWDIEEANEPVKVFERHGALVDLPIFSYAVDTQKRFGALIGIKRGESGGLNGLTQLFSFKTQTSHVVNGLQACFLSTPERSDSVSICLSYKEGKDGKFVMYALSDSNDFSQEERVSASVDYNDLEDFPVAMYVSPKYKLLFIISRNGYFHLFDVRSGRAMFNEKVSSHTVYSAVPNDAGGLNCVNALGSLFKIGINDSVIVNFIQSNLHDNSLAVSVASNAGLPGGDVLMKDNLKDLLDAKNIDAAIKCVLNSPNHALRTRETIRMFTECGQANPQIQPPPISTYYKQLLAIGKLTEVESFEFAKTVVLRGGLQMLKKLIDDNKLELSGDLGSIISPHDEELALRVLHRANEHEKVVHLLLSRGDFGKVTAYCDRVKFAPEWKNVIQDCIQKKLDVSVQVATMMHKLPNHGGIEPFELVNLFLRAQCIKQLTLYLLEILKGDRAEDADLQTRLLEINLKHSPPQVAEQIFLQNIVSHYDALTIAPLCEKAQLYRWALECYIKAQRETKHQTAVLKEMKRCMRNMENPSADWLVGFFGQLSQDDGLELFEDFVSQDADSSYKVSVQIAAKYYGVFGVSALVDIFLKYNAFRSIYFFLGSVKDFSTDPEVHYRYIEAAIHEDEMKELERFTRETSVYDPSRTKALLFEKSLEDARPLINVCDKHGYVQEMIKYFIQNKNFPLIEQYVQKYSPNRTPEVVGVLLDFNYDDDSITNLVQSVGSICSSDELIAEVEKRNKISILQPWLEQKLRERTKEPAVHNILAKIYINQGKAADFIAKNEFYDPLVIGNYCENREPNIAFQAYAKGKCDEEIVRLSFANGLFKQLAVYLVQRQDLSLWGTVLENESREALVDAVIQSALPESNVPEEVSVTVKAFMKANLHDELTALLEKIVMYGPKEFRQNKYLQNLLILTAIKAKKEKVMDYIDQLSGYDAKEIARVAIANTQFELAFAAYSKHEMEEEAMQVLVNDIQSVERAQALAEKANMPAVWTLLADAYLARKDVAAGVDALIHAENTDYLSAIADVAEESHDYQHLVKYIRMVRSARKQSTPKIDAELLYSLAKIGDLAELRDFVESTRIANVQQVADRCKNEGLYEAACVLFRHCNDYHSLSLTYISMGNFREAVEAAQKANSVQLWRDLVTTCVENKELELANMCATQLIPHADELYVIIELYEASGLYDDIIAVLHDFLGNANAHMGVFTELSILYVKYYPEKAFDFVKMYHKRLNKHKMIMHCTNLCMWEVSCFLYQISEEWDSAASLMLSEPAFTWEHEMFMNILNKVSSDDLITRAIDFYFEYQPSLINELLLGIRNRMDLDNVLKGIRKNPHAFMTRPFLESMASKNLSSVKTFLIELCIAENDIDGLTAALENCTNFHTEEIGDLLIGNSHRAFRLIGAGLLMKHRSYPKAIEVYKAEKLYTNVVATAAKSGDEDLVVECMDWFITEGRRECFAALAFLSVDCVPPEVVMEKGFVYNEMELLMPFFVQTMASQRKTIARLQRSLDGKASESSSHLKTIQGKSSQLLLQ